MYSTVIFFTILHRLLQAASIFLVTITSHFKCRLALGEKLEGEAELLVINIRQGGN